MNPIHALIMDLAAPVAVLVETAVCDTPAGESAGESADDLAAEIARVIAESLVDDIAAALALVDDAVYAAAYEIKGAGRFGCVESLQLYVRGLVRGELEYQAARATHYSRRDTRAADGRAYGSPFVLSMRRHTACDTTAAPSITAHTEEPQS